MTQQIRTSAKVLLVLFVLTACGDDGSVTTPTQPPAPKPTPPWLEVGWISREPRLPPPDSLDDPLHDPHAGWPEPGSEVRWAAHLLNRGADSALAVPYRWLLDGAPVDSGSVDIPVGASTVEWPWPWSFQRHRVTFELMPAKDVDSTTGDDTLTVLTDALSVGFWVQRATYDWLVSGGQTGFERHAQRWLVAWNALLSRESSSSSPDGVLDRLRLDRVEVLADADGYPSDLDTDFVWYFRNQTGDRRFLYEGAPQNVLDDQGIVLHEMLHERGATDLYAYKVGHGLSNGSFVGIEEGGSLVAGTDAMPFLDDGVSVYKPALDGLMGDLYDINYTHITEHTAYGLNLRAGLRTPRWVDQWGNHIDAFQKGPYVNLIPDTTLVHLRSPDGAPLSRAHVDLFVDHGQEVYQDIYGAEPDRAFDADDGGVFRLPGDILDGTYTVDTFPKSWTLILRVKHQGQRAYVFLPGYELNLVYFEGAHHAGPLDLTVDLQ